MCSRRKKKTVKRLVDKDSDYVAGCVLISPMWLSCSASSKRKKTLKRPLFPPRGGGDCACRAEALGSKGSNLHRPGSKGNAFIALRGRERRASGSTGRLESAFCYSSQFKHLRMGHVAAGRPPRWRCERRGGAPSRLLDTILLHVANVDWPPHFLASEWSPAY